MIGWNDTVDLLKLAAHYDQRTVGDEDIRAWLFVAEAERWQPAAAQRAIVDHYRRGAGRPRITAPAISDRIRAVRAQAAQSFEAPRIPEDLPTADYPSWLRARITDHVDVRLAEWARTGVEPAEARPALPPPAVRHPGQLPKAAPSRVQRVITTGIDRLLGRRLPRDPDTRRLARAEIERARAEQPEPPAAPPPRPPVGAHRVPPDTHT